MDISNYLDQVAKMEKDLVKMRAALDDLEHLQNIHHGHVMDPRSVIVVIPHNKQLFDHNKEVLQTLGWKWDNDMNPNPSSGVVCANFYKDGIQINIQLIPDMVGSTCKRNLIGYDKQPIYELTCMEAEALV